MALSTVTLTSASAPGVSAAVNLNWSGGGTTAVSLTWNSSSTASAVSLQYTMDDLQRLQTLGAGSSTATWQFVASSAASSTIAVFGASVYFDTGFTQVFSFPICAVRMNSSALTTGSSQKIFMKVVQGE